MNGRKSWNKIVITHMSSLVTSETSSVFEGKVQAFERPYFHDERERLSTRYYESLATYAGQACLPLSLVAPRLMYLCISTDWLLLDSHSRIHAGKTASRTSVNRPYSLRTIKKKIL